MGLASLSREGSLRRATKKWSGLRTFTTLLSRASLPPSPPFHDLQLVASASKQLLFNTYLGHLNLGDDRCSLVEYRVGLCLQQASKQASLGTPVCLASERLLASL